MIPKNAGEFLELDEKRFAEIVTAAFSQRRKTLRNTLGKVVGENAFAQAGIDLGLRAENLSVSDFEKLALLKSGT
jgi:16S rRNA (adenine1518-N6/adenine1519-N6)-dimethyltransferase